MTSFDPWGSPAAAPVEGWRTVLPERGASRLREDATRFVAVVAGIVLLGAPVGLLWSALAPRYTVVFDDKGEVSYPFIESTKAFIGVDGTYFAITALAGVLCGVAAWYLARRSGPWTVLALALGSVLAALVAARVGLLPTKQAAFDAINAHKGSVDLFLGARDCQGCAGTHLRAPWAAVGWPVFALVGFLVPAMIRPEELD